MTLLLYRHERLIEAFKDLHLFAMSTERLNDRLNERHKSRTFRTPTVKGNVFRRTSGWLQGRGGEAITVSYDL